MLVKTKFYRYNTRMNKKRQALVLSCHPDPRSFCRAIAQNSTDYLKNLGTQTKPSPVFEVKHLDIYDKPINPIMSPEELSRKTSFDPEVQEYVRIMESLDLLILVYPDWWGQMPGLLKGWFDRVFRPGLAYTFVGPDEGPKEPQGLLSSLQVVVFVTTDRDGDSLNQPYSTQLEKQAFETKQTKLIKPKARHTTTLVNTPHHSIWQQISEFTQLDLVNIKVFGPMYRASLGQRKDWLHEVEVSLESFKL